MKTIYAALLLVLVLGFGLVGCADNEETTTPDQADQADDAVAGNDTGNTTPPLGTGYAGRGNIAETDN